MGLYQVTVAVLKPYAYPRRAWVTKLHVGLAILSMVSIQGTCVGSTLFAVLLWVTATRASAIFCTAC